MGKSIIYYCNYLKYVLDIFLHSAKITLTKNSISAWQPVFHLIWFRFDALKNAPVVLSLLRLSHYIAGRIDSFESLAQMDLHCLIPVGGCRR